LLFALLAAANAAPVTPDEQVPAEQNDQEAQNQFFYSYGYGYPYYAPAVLPAVKAVASPAAVPASTVKVLSPTVYSYPAAYPYYAYHYPYLI